MPRALRRPSATGAALGLVLAVVLAAVVAVRCSGDDGTGGTPAPATQGPDTAASVPSTTGAAAPTSTAASPGAPAWPGDFPDPFVLVDEGRYYAYATEGGRIRVQRLSSSTPYEWGDLGEALDATPAWAAPFSTWAPAVLRRGDRYVLFYSALVAGTDRHCIGRAEASDPRGPFVDESPAPFLCPTDLGGAIDPSPFVDDDGRVYLLWKSDGITQRREAVLWSLPLDEDASVPAGESARLIGTDQRWEYPHVEGPTMARVGTAYWLAYSGNWWNQDAYGVGLARCDGPLGPCSKPLDAPVLSSRPGAYGPGGLELFRDAGGQLLAAYHAWREAPGYPGERALWIAVVDTSGAVPSLAGR